MGPGLPLVFSPSFARPATASGSGFTGQGAGLSASVLLADKPPVHADPTPLSFLGVKGLSFSKPLEVRRAG